MRVVQAAVIKSVQAYLKSLNANGFKISFGVLFGSQALGTATEWSDIDLIVVSPDFDKEIQCKTKDTLWQIAGRVDSRIEPVPCGIQRWQKDDYTPIIDIARNEGQIVTGD